MNRTTLLSIALVATTALFGESSAASTIRFQKLLSGVDVTAKERFTLVDIRISDVSVRQLVNVVEPSRPRSWWGSSRLVSTTISARDSSALAELRSLLVEN